MGQQSLEDLVLAIAEEAVRVQGVVLAIQTKLQCVSHILHFLLSHERYLGGCTAEIESSHCRSARAQPAAHKTILQQVHRDKQRIKSGVCVCGDMPSKREYYTSLIMATRCHQAPISTISTATAPVSLIS